MTTELELNPAVTASPAGNGASKTQDLWIATNLPTILRVLGAGVLLVTMYSFLMDGWRGGNDAVRYLMMLGATGLLALLGLMSARWLQETKGARLLITLALASVPVNFAILGAFVYALLGAMPATGYPAFAAWRLSDPVWVWIICVSAAAVLIPLVLFGFRVLARGMSAGLGMIYLINNGALLLPFRDGPAVAWLVSALLVLSLLLNRKLASHQIAARTREGLTAMGLLYLPLAVLMGRSLWLYSQDLLILAAMSASLFIMFRQAAVYMEEGGWFCGVLEVLSLLPALAMIPAVTGLFLDTGFLADNLALPAAGSVSALMINDVARRSSAGTGYRLLACAVVLATFLSNLAVNDGFAVSLMCIVAGGVLVTMGIRSDHRSHFACGVVLFVAGIWQQVYDFIHHFEFGSWIGLALLGIAAIICGSVLETRNGRVGDFTKRWKSICSGWRQ